MLINNQKNKSKDLIVILGPTASGKTSLAVQLAFTLNGEIISADSRQIYKKMDIGTGKDLDEYIINNKKIPYHLIDIHEPMFNYNLSKFLNDFEISFNYIKSKKKQPILCGGTGLYIKSVLLNFQIPPVIPNILLRSKLEKLNLNQLKKKLEEIKPSISNDVPTDTKRRIIRTIEVELYRKKSKQIMPKKSIKKFNNDNITVIGINYPRKIIRERITSRLIHRLNNGMIHEVDSLLKEGVSSKRLEEFGLEYKYINHFLNKKISKNEMISKLNTAIHQFAKKQMTFFRNIEKNGVKINWVENTELIRILKLIDK
tara:strand:- start:1337 stop:2278 length:942 start_codon:yes stop_codon:yes gene_type:complete